MDASRRFEGGWTAIEEEAQHAFVGHGRFPLPAYSEFMPSPYVGIKPYDPMRSSAAATAGAGDEMSLDVSEYERVQELRPGLNKIAGHVLAEIQKLARGRSHDLSRTLLADNPAWPPALIEASKAGRFADAAFNLILPLALSRTQDDKGNVRWTLFGASHDGAARPFWRSFADWERERFGRLVAWSTGESHASQDGVRVLAPVDEVPAFARPLLLSESEPVAGVRTLVTFRPFATLPPAVQQAYIERKLRLVPSPSSLIFFEHPQYRKLAEALPRAAQIPLLHLFPRVEGGYDIRIPQSGWLDEHDPGQNTAGHRVVQKVVRTHRWQRTSKAESLGATGGAGGPGGAGSAGSGGPGGDGGDGAFTDAVSVVLFSTNPDDLGLYGKPMARNAQIWRADYRLLLDGPRASLLEIERAAEMIDKGGRFGYRFYYPPMRAGRRELFWHLPLVARLDPGASAALVCEAEPPGGYVLAEPQPEETYLPRVALEPRLLDRPGHREAATLFDRETGRARYTTCHNVRRLLEFAEYLGAPLAPSLARSLVHVARDQTLDAWLGRLPELASERAGGERLAATLRGLVGAPLDVGSCLTLDGTSSRAFEETVWRTIASLAEGEFRLKDNADAVLVNKGKTGGPAAQAAHLALAERRDLERLGDHLHQRHRALIDKHGMTGRARVVDHVFRWETDFEYAWSGGWAQNQSRETHERNIVVMIPGRNRGEAVIMGDHYDTAYMEDVFEEDKGGDGLRAAAAGADDNHSATTALLCAADQLLALSAAGRLERDVWLVHLTGEEFPSDCLGARALCQALVERRLRFSGEDGEIVDVSRVRAVGAYVLDMIGHNNHRDRDVFQISPGEGAGSARLAARAHLANERWNARVRDWNRAPERAGLGRAQRMETGRDVPPPFAHLALHGEIRTEWGPRSALYNTDGQIFSDVGIPVVLFMENYDISRTGYHDTHDTMKNIDLDYAAALTAIAIEAVAETACAPRV